MIFVKLANNVAIATPFVSSLITPVNKKAKIMFTNVEHNEINNGVFN